MLAFEAELADRGGPQLERAAPGRRQIDPAGARNPAEVPVRDEHDVAAGVDRPLERAVGALADVVDGLTAGEAVAPDLPVRALGADLLRRLALDVAVVPLHQVVVELRAVAEAGELGGLARALERGDE